MAIDKSVHICISQPKYNKEVMYEIICNIQMDILCYKATHGKNPASILVTPALHMALRDNIRGVVNYIVDADRQEWLFGIRVSRYYPVECNDDHIMAYQLTWKERRFEFNKEGDHESC